VPREHAFSIVAVCGPLPPDLTMGSYEGQDLTDRGVGNLFEGKVIVDKTYGHAAYGCATCCGYADGAYMYWDPISVLLDFGSDQDVWDIDFCTQTRVSVLDYFPPSGWGTGDPSIATANGHVLTGVAPGSTTNSAQGTLVIGNVESHSCPRVQQSPSGSANVTPAITKVVQNVGASGFVPLRSSSVSDGDNYISYTATCNPSSGSFTWSANTTNVTLKNTDSPTVVVYGATASKALNDASIQVTCSANSKTSDPYAESLSVQQPTKLVKTGTDTTSSEATCDSSTGCGVTRTLNYQVYDQLNPANPIQAQLDFFDGIATVPGSNGCNLGSYTLTCPTDASCGKLTGTGGTFPDQLPICAPACISGGKCVGQCADGPTNANQTWTVNGFALSGDVKALTYNCTQVLVNGQ
jgi:hypothetical protein